MDKYKKRTFKVIEYTALALIWGYKAGWLTWESATYVLVISGAVLDVATADD